jgi:hypothetical protein
MNSTRICEFKFNNNHKDDDLLVPILEVSKLSLMNVKYFVPRSHGRTLLSWACLGDTEDVCLSISLTANEN